MGALWWGAAMAQAIRGWARFGGHGIAPFVVSEARWTLAIAVREVIGSLCRACSTEDGRLL
jgi:hypothetical protein